MEQIKQQYVTATAIGSMVACLLMGLVANLPVALAPGEISSSIIHHCTSFHIQ